MKKIVVIGSPGAGKTTFANQLGDILGIEIIHLDRHFWYSRWWEHSRKIRKIREQELTANKEQWIIEGTYLGSSTHRLNQADTIIFLDVPPVLCLQRLIKRHYELRGCSRSDIPERCTDKLNLRCILKVLVFPFRGRKELEKRLRNCLPKEIIPLHSNTEVQDFLLQQKHGIFEREPTSRMSSAHEEFCRTH